MQYKTLCFLDIDGTLLDSSYKNNCAQLVEMISQLEKRGVIFILNSNRALEDLLPVAQEFGIHGLLIGENGIFIHDRQTRVTTTLVPPDETALISRIISTLPGAIKTYMDSQTPGISYRIIKADTVSFIKNHSRTAHYPNGSVLFLCNKFRKYTASIHVKRLAGTALVPDLQTAQQCSQLLASQHSFSKFSFSVSELFANILVSSRAVSKHSAVLWLKHNPRFKDYNCIAIGDEQSDAEMIDKIGRFFTTANAQVAVKNRAEMTASHPYAQGVLEILETVFSHE